MLWLNKEEQKNQLNIFYDVTCNIAGPYFKNFGFICKVYRGRTTVSFEKIIENKTMQIFFTSELRLGFKRFHINYFTDIIVPDDKYPNKNWSYEDKNELENCIKKSLEIIENQKKIPIWESRFHFVINQTQINSGSARVLGTNI
jgi:hypothetical protein